MDKSEYGSDADGIALQPTAATPKPRIILLICNETGTDGLQGHKKEAVKWYRRGAIYGNSMSQFNLGRLYLYGLGVQQSNNEALHWLQKSADAGCPRAVAALAMVYAKGQGVPHGQRNSSPEAGEKSC